MASTEPEVTCPVCEDYSGGLSSVEAHISSSAGEHSGEVGKEHRDSLEEQVAYSDLENPSDDGVTELEATEDDGAMSDRDAALAAGATGAAFAVPTFIDDMDASTMLAVAGIVLLIVLYSGGDSGESEEAAAGEEENQPDVGTGGPGVVVGGA